MAPQASDELNGRVKSITEWINKIPQKDKDKINKDALEKTEKDYQIFINKLKKGICSLCGESMDSVIPKKMCLHWLLYPLGMKKKYLLFVLNCFDFSRVDSYLRWIANSELPHGKNINDIHDESQTNAVISTTIKFKEIEWALLCTKSDFVGHPKRKAGRFPHYHLSLTKNGRPMLKFGDYHIKLSDPDRIFIKAQRGEIPNVQFRHGRGSGMQDYFDDKIDPEVLLNTMTSTGNEMKANFHMSTIVEADEGTTISSEDLQKIFEEHKKTKKPLALLARQLKNISIKTKIEPGEGVPQMKQNLSPRSSSKESLEK